MWLKFGGNIFLIILIKLGIFLDNCCLFNNFIVLKLIKIIFNNINVLVKKIY